MTLPVSVVIPTTHGRAQYIRGAVDSVKNQSDEVVVIYDGEYPRITGIEYPIQVYATMGEYRSGVCYSRNLGIKKTCNNLILPLDDDDRLYPDALERMYAAWQPGTFVYGNYTEIDEQENVIREMNAPPPGTLHRKNLTYSTFLFDRDDWLRVGGYDPDFESHEEDYAFQCALVNAGVKPIRLEGAPLYRRMIHTNSRTAKAMKYWNVTVEMCKERYPGAFVV